MAQSKNVTWQVGRDAINGRLISIAEANRRPATSTIETMKRPR